MVSELEILLRYCKLQNAVVSGMMSFRDLLAEAGVHKLEESAVSIIHGEEIANVAS